MPNIDAAFGLRPYNMLGAGANTNGNATYNIQTAATAGTANVIYQGSPVIPLANGTLDIVGNANGGTVALLGVFLGCNYIDLSGKPKWSPYWPGTASVLAGSVATAEIASHPDQLFLINCDAGFANAATNDAAVHANANFATATSGSTVSGLSAGELAVSTINTTNTLNLRIIGFEDSPANSDPTSAGRLAIVMLNNHFYRYNSAAGGGGAGAGI